MMMMVMMVVIAGTSTVGDRGRLCPEVRTTYMDAEMHQWGGRAVMWIDPVSDMPWPGRARARAFLHGAGYVQGTLGRGTGMC